MKSRYFTKNLFPFVITTFLVINIIPISGQYSSADDLIAAMLPKNGKNSAATISTDDLAESIYQNLIKRTLPAQEQLVADKAKAQEVRAAVENDIMEQARRKGRARKFLQRIKHSKETKKRIMAMRRMDKLAK